MRAFFLCLPLSAAFAWSSWAQESATPVRSSQAIAVEYVPVEVRPLTMELQLTGNLTAQDSIVLSFPSGGRITEMLVEAGDSVTKGQALARTDNVQQQQALNRATAGLAAAEAADRQARQAADRADAMLNRGVGTRAARDMAHQALSAAQGQLANARTTLDQARRADEDTILRAPRDAVITSRSAESGQVVGAAQPILSLAAMTRLEAVFQVPDSQLLDGALGAHVVMSPMDRPDRDLVGQVSEIAPLVDPSTGAVTVKVAIDGPLDAGLLGTAVIGRLQLPTGGGIELPWTALTVTGNQSAVWKIGRDNTVSVVPVELERYSTDSFVVQSGLTPGETVVGEGSQLMYPGREVFPGKPRS